MKTIINVILVLAVLCLAGCKKDGPYVQIAIDRTEISRNGGTVNVTVSSNSQWLCVMKRGQTPLEEWRGEGDKSFPASIEANPFFEEQTYTLLIQTPGGSPESSCSFLQEERAGIFPESVGMISEQGGTFEIPVKTNDDITSVDTPDWIAFTSGRALTDCTYSFTAEPNRTGAVRTGKITLNGKNASGTVEVTQDSYAPESIELDRDLSCIWEQSFKVRISAEPEYADLSKLEVKMLPDGNAVIEDGCLAVDLGHYGEFSISILRQGKGMLYTEGVCIPTEPFRYEDALEVYLGQRRFIDYLFYAEDYDLTSSDERIASPSGNKYVYGNGIGEAVLTVTHPVAPSHDELSVKVVPFLVDARIGWTGEKWDGSFDVRFAIRVEGTESMSCDGFCITDKDGTVRILNEGKIVNFSKTVKEISTSVINVKYDRSKYSDIGEFLKGWQAMVQTSIGKNAYQRTKAIDTTKTGF